MTTFRLSGHVIDSQTNEGLAALRVEAWDKDLIYNDLVGSTITDEQGAFQIEFNESYFRELFLERRPDLFFKVFSQEKLIKSTEDSVLWNVAAGETQIVIPVDETLIEEDLKMHQSVSGQLSLKNVQEIDPDLRLKIAVARDCRVIKSQVFQLKPGQSELQYTLDFEHEYSKAIGVRLVVGLDVPDEQLRSVEHHQVWLPAKSFIEGVVNDVELLIPERLYRFWLGFCRTYTLRGRVVCRRWIWDPIEQMFVACDAPVRGALVKAFDADCFWWWCRRDQVGSDFTDINGYFEIKFTWCCWWWRPWLLKTWQLDPALVGRIRELLSQVPLDIPIPQPDPVPDLSIFERLVASTNVALPQPIAADPTPEPATELITETGFVQLGETLVRRLPKSPELEALRVWPWWPFFDCKPDIVFEVTQDCGEGDQTIYSETNFQTRWNIDPVLNGVTLVANQNACCGPFCCSDPPDEDCLVFQGVGCGGYPIENIEQDLANPLVGYAYPGTNDRPFGGTISLLGVFGDASEVDFYKLQRRRISPSPTGWVELPDTEVGNFIRRHWLGVFPWLQNEVVKLDSVDGEKVLKTTNRYREEHPEVDTGVDPINADRLTNWITASGSLVNGTPMAGLTDGVYELRVVGYRYDAANDKLVDQKVMALCPPTGEEVDPANHSTLRLRLDNRVVSSISGSIHLNTSEPDCDFPDICAIVKNEDPTIPLSQQKDNCIDPCGFVRLSAGDTLTIHFEATDSDGHLEGYQLTAHWAESRTLNVLTAGTLAGDPDSLYGPRYANTFLSNQGTYRASLPPTNPEHDRPFWYGGKFKVTVTVDDKVFETCCAYSLRLRVWKRTTNGCTGSYYFHYNHCDFSFTVIREDLIGNPNHPSCTEICPSEKEQNSNTIVT